MLCVGTHIPPLRGDSIDRGPLQAVRSSGNEPPNRASPELASLVPAYILANVATVARRWPRQVNVATVAKLVRQQTQSVKNG